MLLDGLTVVVDFGNDNVVDSVDEVKNFSGNLITVLFGSGKRLDGDVKVVSVNFAFEVSEFILLLTVVLSRRPSNPVSGVVEIGWLIFESILSALASIISRPALIKSKKLFSVDGRALKGCRVVTSITVCAAVVASSCGSSEPKRSEKKSIESPSSSGSSSLCCLVCRLAFNDLLQS